MGQSYAYTPHIWPSLLTVALLVTLAAYSGRRRTVPGALPFAIATAFGAIWACATAMEAAAVNAVTRSFWIEIQLICQIPTTSMITCFILDYAWPGRRLVRCALAVAVLVSLASAVSLADSSSGPALRQLAQGGSIASALRPLGWAMAGYAYLLGLINLGVLIWLYRRSPQHRWPVVIIVIGQVAARAIYVMDVLSTPHPELPLDTLGIGVVFAMYAIVLYGFRIFDPIPLANRALMEQMRAAVLVLDTHERVVSTNAIAEEILGVTAREAKLRPVKELLPAYPEGLTPAGAGTEMEMGLGDGPALRSYQALVWPLRDWRGGDAGRLLVLRDVTEQKDAQAQIAEQQRRLDVLQERERLAREVHDSVGQVLGYVSMQAQAIVKRLRDGEVSGAEGQLTRLADVARDAHIDVRESIVNLRSGAPEGRAFLTALRQQLETYQTVTGIRTKLSLSDGLSDDDFLPGAGAQLLRVIQEALTNVRKHSQAGVVRVGVSRDRAHAVIVVSDNGRGFDPQSSPDDGQQHFGLAFMQERLAEIGGSLTLSSGLGAGTELRLRVPIQGPKEVLDESPAGR